MTYSIYAEYQDSNVDWMGKIPSNWSIQKLKFLSQNFDNKRMPISAGEREEGKYPYYGATGIVDYVNDYIFNENLLLVGEDGAPFFDENKDVAFLISGKSWVNNHAHVLKIDETLILDKLVMHSLNCTDYSLYIKGSTRDKLNQDQLKNIPVIIPPREEQPHIVNYLDKQTAKIDAIITKNEELIQLLEEKRVTLINQVVTKGLNPDAPMKDSGVEWIGEIPQNWDVVPFKRLFNNIKDGTHGSFQRVSDGEPLLSAKNVFDDTINISENESLISKEDYNSIVANGFPKRGDLLLTIVGTIGRSCVYDKEYPLAFQRSVAFIRLTHDNPYYYNYFVKSDIFYSQLMTNAKESAQKGVYLNDIKECLVIRPTIEAQSEIADYLFENITKINKMIYKVQNNIELLEEYKTSLIHHVVTGKIDVREEVI